MLIYWRLTKALPCLIQYSLYHCDEWHQIMASSELWHQVNAWHQVIMASNQKLIVMHKARGLEPLDTRAIGNCL